MAKSECRISAVLIVKNEAALLARCLASLKGVDEIVVCDTGSTDDTVAIAKQYTPHVYTDYVWADDFAAARNHAKSKATCDWILSIDGDEFIEAGGIDKLRELAEAGTHTAFGVDLVSEFSAAHVHRCIRFFQRDRVWAGRIHEVISGPSAQSHVRITYGHSPAHDMDPGRSFRILQAAHDDCPTDQRTLYYLAREHYYRGEYTKALALFTEYTAAPVFWKPERADAYLFMARCYWQLRAGDKARDMCLHALNLNANFKEAACFMAEISWPGNARVWLAMADAADNSDVLFVRATKRTPDFGPVAPGAPKLADIVIPHHNRHDLLSRCLACIDNRVFNVYVISGHGSFANNVNVGARFAKTDRIIILNDDTEPDNETLKQMATVDADVCGVTEISPAGRKTYGLWVQSAPGEVVNAYPAYDPHYVHIPHGFCFAVKRRFWEAVSGLDERYRNGGEDSDFGLRALEAGGSIAYVDRPMLHRVSSSAGRFDHAVANERLLGERWTTARAQAALMRHRPWSMCVHVEIPCP